MESMCHVLVCSLCMQRWEEIEKSCCSDMLGWSAKFIYGMLLFQWASTTKIHLSQGVGLVQSRHHYHDNNDM
jgi:hypothetical protein